MPARAGRRMLDGMAVNLRQRSLLSALDLTAEELRYLIALSAELKAAARGGTEQPRLAGKRIALVLDEQAPVMTSGAFAGAANDQGARVMPMTPAAAEPDHNSYLKYTARVLGQAFDAIEYRGFGHQVVEDLAVHAGVPVYRGLSDESLAIRALAGLLTMQEHAGKPLHDIAYCYVGDGRFGVVDSLMIMGARLGMDVRICAPYRTWPDAGLVTAAYRLADGNGGRFLLTDDADQGASGADFLYTGMPLFIGEDRPVWGQHIRLLCPCQPAGRWRSIMFDEAENRRHAIKAVLVATLAD